MRITLTAAASLKITGRRQLAGTLYRIGEVGQTSAGPLSVASIEAVEVPVDLTTILLNRDHNRRDVVGHLLMLDDTAERRYIAVQLDDGPEGDDALDDAQTRRRAAFSYEIEDAEVVDGVIVSGRLAAIALVAEPAYNSARIDQIAASKTAGASRKNTQGDAMPLTPEQIARLAELRAKTDRTPEEDAELQQLTDLALDQVAAPTASEPTEPAVTEPAAAATEPSSSAVPAAQPVAASVPATPPAIPGGNPAVTASASTSPQGGSALEKMISGMVQALRVRKAGGNALQAITAALTDVVNTDHTGHIEQLGWSGELFSGVAYESVFSQNLDKGPLENWEGKGWRFTQTPAVQDYAGDKAPIPTGTVGTEESLWEAAIAAVGIDIDRKFFDFPNGEFLASLFAAMAESVTILHDEKSGLYITSEAVEVTRKATVAIVNADATVTTAAGLVTADDIGRPITGTGIPAGTTVLSVTDATHFEMSANATATNAAVAVEIGQSSPSLLKAAARVAQSMTRRYNGTKAPSSSGPDYLYVNDEDWFGMLDLTELQLPAYLSSYGVKPETFIPTEDTPSGFVIGGVKKAAKLRTEANPIVIDALNIAAGGVDKAFHTYWAIEQQHKRGVQKASFTDVIES